MKHILFISKPMGVIATQTAISLNKTLKKHLKKKIHYKKTSIKKHLFINSYFVFILNSIKHSHSI